MDVTVVIPTIPPRVADYLPDAVASVKEQTVPTSLIVVSDDLKQGATAARNKALEDVETEWVAFLDDDDFLYPTHVERLLHSAKKNQADLVYPGYTVNGTDPAAVRVGGSYKSPFGLEFNEVLKNYILTEANFIPITFLVRTELALSVGGFPTVSSDEWPLDCCEDWGFLCKLLLSGAKFHHLPEKTWHWNYRKDSTSGLPMNW